MVSGLKEGLGLYAVEVELKAEGTLFHDLVQLRSLIASQEVPLYLKIRGGIIFLQTCQWKNR